MKAPRVQLMATCLADAFFDDVARATVEVLEHLGCEVSFPEDQTCCDRPRAREIRRRSQGLQGVGSHARPLRVGRQKRQRCCHFHGENGSASVNADVSPRSFGLAPRFLC
jgi:Cysteine-rich domain